jgi:hypothetical protein
MSNDTRNYVAAICERSYHEVRDEMALRKLQRMAPEVKAGDMTYLVVAQ